MIKNGMRPVHPGEVLREDFLVPLGLSANALATALKVPAPRVNEIVRERRGVSADTAMRLARYFGGDARSWLNLEPEAQAPLVVDAHAPLIGPISVQLLQPVGGRQSQILDSVWPHSAEQAA